MLDGRTREGTDLSLLAEIASHPDGMHATIFWATENRRRAAALTRMVEDGRIEADNSRGYPVIIFRAK